MLYWVSGADTSGAIHTRDKLEKFALLLSTKE
jgi:hypothetical protein